MSDVPDTVREGAFMAGTTLTTPPQYVAWIGNGAGPWRQADFKVDDEGAVCRELLGLDVGKHDTCGSGKATVQNRKEHILAWGPRWPTYVQTPTGS